MKALWSSKKERKLDSNLEKMNIWFVVSEAEGLVKSGGLADVAKALPKALQELGHQVAIVLPAYRSIPNKMDLPIILETELTHWPHTRYQVRQGELDGVVVYLIDCDVYFDRPEMYAEHNQAYTDNGERFGFFSAACLDILPKLNIKPTIIHANDWHTGLVPFLLKTRYREDPHFFGVKSVLTIHNAIFKGIFSYYQLEVIPELNLSGMEFLQYGHDHVSMLRAGIAFADKINAVSPNYASELLTPLGSHGLVDDFVRRARDLHGIVNGCDYSEWSPLTDRYIPQTYHAERQSLTLGKSASKLALQQELNLPQVTTPMFGMVCRLTHQKGFHYLLPILESFLRNQVQVVIVGTGEPEIAAALHKIAAHYPDKLGFVETYSNRLAHLVEAGSDFFLMPSEFEACGLNQIYSMAYGTLPIVREVGGLKDTVQDYDKYPQQATGFGFQEPSPAALLITMQRALLFYLQQPEEMLNVQIRAMSRDFGWRESALEYLKMYRLAIFD
ncbi:glycogen synthase GlgA [Vibrio metschnikovii]|nr:glycogen synthase GlgA [Vibrio metschnikovii]EKO3556225.1 glycogen synthase GlgA [Vibrio metschnikovii]EKO3559251.1 glycogen synthase GlgA [Vibrio metschnikovii]EKO3567717.1 glycogen synthase GlgA [Vibrio metschnikovii]EKO3580477.1 glycogen synthase GlgA [Vibrio metschnikovii]EKO3602101.1 glycogen synthase GlgA [Vibrio metschnikovii]